MKHSFITAALLLIAPTISMGQPAKSSAPAYPALAQACRADLNQTIKELGAAEIQKAKKLKEFKEFSAIEIAQGNKELTEAFNSLSKNPEFLQSFQRWQNLSKERKMISSSTTAPLAISLLDKEGAQLLSIAERIIGPKSNVSISLAEDAFTLGSIGRVFIKDSGVMPYDRKEALAIKKDLNEESPPRFQRVSFLNMAAGDSIVHVYQHPYLSLERHAESDYHVLKFNNMVPSAVERALASDEIFKIELLEKRRAECLSGLQLFESGVDKDSSQKPNLNEPKKLPGHK